MSDWFDFRDINEDLVMEIRIDGDDDFEMLIRDDDGDNITVYLSKKTAIKLAKMIIKEYKGEMNK
tara:strand:+ start:205 stop:399 length:195 start_codon:yes stop_codon:yes gene_type:complete